MNFAKKIPSLILSLLLLTIVCEGASQEEAVTGVLFEATNDSEQLTDRSANDEWLYNFPDVLPYIEDFEEDDELEVDAVFSKIILAGDCKNSSEEIKEKGDIVSTYAVSVMTYNGFWFHVAIYSDARIVTCLDGPMIGCQRIMVNGIQLPDCYNVSWHKNRFVHKHTWGKVYSYPYKQVIKFN